MKIGVVVESMELPLRAALPRAARMGAAGVQVDAAGDLSPERLTDTARRELKNLLRTYAQDLTALNCPLRRGLDVAENQQPRLEYIRRSMAMAFEMGPRIAIAPLPKLPGENEPERARLLREALLDLGRHGDRVGCVLALEVGMDAPDAVVAYLDTFDVGSLKVNYDPANLLVNGLDPIAGIIPLHRRIAHTHARDARRSTVSRGAQEVALGAGDIDWLSYVASLVAVEYRGWLTIERETGMERLRDIEHGVGFLKKMLVPT
ncbi:MAG TPA: sugar phosphate isomerase/epimerase family protein [Gemmataceae bacterium]|jgi:sugar phosphate isomerase/epimerase|nr:sugar phosphate isomerase/epimerase family protein [Gemmataceae bacterium]